MIIKNNKHDDDKKGCMDEVRRKVRRWEKLGLVDSYFATQLIQASEILYNNRSRFPIADDWVHAQDNYYKAIEVVGQDADPEFIGIIKLLLKTNVIMQRNSSTSN